MPRSLNFYIPQCFTALNICCGLLSILSSMSGDYIKAVIFIFAAAFFDLLDGPSARLLKSSSQFGKEFDSLADQLSFGMAPAFLYYRWALIDLPASIGVSMFVIYVLATSIRLARFNSIEIKSSNHFLGLSSPVSAIMLASIIGLSASTLIHPPTSSVTWIWVPLCLAMCMVSNIPFYHHKQMNLKPHVVIPFILLLTALFFWKPFHAVFSILSIYILVNIFLSFTDRYRKGGRSDSERSPNKIGA